MARKPMTRKQRRLTYIAGSVGLLAVAAFLILAALRDSIVFFFSPTELAARPVIAEDLIRVGGLVLEGSLTELGTDHVRFGVTDMETDLTIEFEGALPDLFREGQGVVAQGRLGADGLFRATQVLAKHDENYMPKEVADALKETGHWQDEQDTQNQ